MENKTLGEKIEYYRKRSKRSQMDLEIEIEASAGSLSRIENNQVNPTKETILRICKALNLTSLESANLYELDLDEIPKMIRLANKINSTLDLDEMLDIAVNNIMTDFNLSGVIIFLIEGNFLYTVAVDDAPPGRDFLFKVLGVTQFRLRIDLNSDTGNYAVKSIKHNKPYFSYDAYDFTKDIVSKEITKILSKASHYESGIVLPMKLNERPIGAVLFTKSVKEDFYQEYKSLEAFTDYLSTAVNNAQQYEKLKNGK